MIKYFKAAVFLCFLFSCKNESLETQSAQKKFDGQSLFVKRSNAELGINFENKLTDTPDFNVYKYRNFYNGGGVAIGDINNDGLVDIYMVSNQEKNHLYLNKGNWKFEDITDKAGVAGKKSWATGVTMADVNGDGLLDIYVCNSGDVKGGNKENELFINKGDMTFEEKAAEYGLNDKGYSTHATFFDYDKDGDLDCYILNNSFKAIGSFNLKINERPKRDELGGDKLMRNENGKFVDVSVKAGIYGSVIGFGLGITIGDVNNDNWEDIYISNDFFERDYLYINQQNGTFKEELTDRINSTSAASMGADIADINNDGFNDIFVTDMLPSAYDRLKTVTTFDDWDRYMYGVNNGYHHQFTRNTLQLNNGNGTFSEVARMAGVEASDWSWGALFFDMDLDGLKDLFIANGIYRDLTNQDYLQYVSNESVMRSIVEKDGVNYKKLIDTIPSRPVPNQVYKNNGDLRFESYTSSGLIEPSFSNGSAYGDIDNDGDLDLVVNNINMPCFVYENKARQSENPPHYVKLQLKGEKKNTNAIGARIKVSANGNTYYYENQPSRGFESCMDGRVNIGLGNEKTCDLDIVWPSGLVTSMKNVKVDQMLELAEKDGVSTPTNYPSWPDRELNFAAKVIDYTHIENSFVDFNQERLNYHMVSTRGPCASIADLNGDKINDIFIPGPKGQPSSIWLGDGNTYKLSSNQVDLQSLSESEHIKCELFDADNDGDTDAYVASGGVEISEYSDFMYDALLLNDGKGNMKNSMQKLPSDEARISTGAVTSGDMDGDGDIDLFVGERIKISNYGAPCSGYLLSNDGKGQFVDITESACPELAGIGMITDAKFIDLDGDKLLDLVVVGEFMDVYIFKNNGKNFSKIKTGIELSGWWNVIESSDIDNDGDQDLILGNHGHNSRFRANEKQAVKLFHYDYDQNGMSEGIIALTGADGKDYPVALRHNLMSRLPGLKKKYPDYNSFKNADMQDIFGSELLSKAKQWKAVKMSTIILKNDGKMNFKAIDLPYSVQVSPIYAIASHDINGDGFEDLVMGGNLYGVQPEMGRYDASYAHVLINDGKGSFIDKSKQSNIKINGQVKDILIDKKFVHFFKNNDKVESILLSNILKK